MTTTEAIKQLQTEHDLIATERDLDGSQFAPALLEALAMAIEVMQGDGDTISRQAAINAINTWDKFGVDERSRVVRWHEGLEPYVHLRDVVAAIGNLPPAQPERTCVNCGRTVNNGGWYADGRTRCPIEEHYALPKDGYCHLWEKVNVWNDNYPEEEVKNERFDKQTGGD